MLRKILYGEYLSRYINICISHDHTIRFVILVLFLSVIFSFKDQLFAQTYHTESNKALKAYKEGMIAYDFFEFSRAETSFKQAVESDEKFYEAHMMLGELYFKLKRYSESAAHYRNAVELDSVFYTPVYLSLANSELFSGDYENALIHFNIYLSQQNISDKNKAIALKNKENCIFALKALKNPVSFNPVNIGDAINTRNDEYWPSITVDGQTLMFTREISTNSMVNSYKSFQEDFYISYRSESGWKTAINAGRPLNTRQNEGAQTLSSNGNYMYFTACDRPGGLGSCDIYFSSLSDGKWSEPVNLHSPVNTSFWDSQPSISADGNILFFSSNRTGGFGGKDLWCSVMNENRKWTKPVNLGSRINTEGDEMSPFIHFDGKSLYFSSDGRPGMGGFDIYLTRLEEDSIWSEPLNLGYPINSYNDEMGLVIESEGQKAYFSSIRNNTNGKDIFYFNLDESLRPDPVAYLKGKVFDKETGRFLKADFELINLTKSRTIIKDATDHKGDFLVCLPSGYNYGLSISKSGYLFYSESFMFEGQYSVMRPFLKNIFLSPLKVGETMLLSNVFFEIDSWQLKKESLSELNKLKNLLLENMEIVVEIGGYTDSTGKDEYNLVLSEKRALAVVSYLIDNGISPDRLKYKGYGNSFPVGDNITTEGRRLNRRTEVKIVARK